MMNSAAQGGPFKVGQPLELFVKKIKVDANSITEQTLQIESELAEDSWFRSTGQNESVHCASTQIPVDTVSK